METNQDYRIIFRRASRIYQFLLLFAIIVAARIIYVQFFKKDIKSGAEIAFRDKPTEPVRGDILDKKGRLLASSIPYYKVRIDCTVSEKDTFDKYVDGLSRALAGFYKEKTEAQYKKLLTEGRANNKRYLNISRRLLDYSELQQVKEFPLFNKGANNGGIIVEEEYKRKYPYGRTAFRTIGFINSEGRGTGIESSWDYYLKGTPGKQIYQRLTGGEWVPVNSENNLPPKDGYDIRTTIDIDLQEAVENALKEQLTKGYNVEGATAVVMERRTGAIRAIANLKNDGKGGFDESLNYAVSQATEPGSVLKLVTLVAVLEDGKETLESIVDGGNGTWVYQGQRVTDSHAVGVQTVKGAFAHSSNVCFAKIATRNYAGNPKEFVNRIQNMKLGEKFHLDIQGEGTAVIHSPDWENWTPGTLASMGFGYGLLITPLHTLTFYNAIANDGRMMKPYFIESYEKDGHVVKKFKPQEISGSICSKKTAEKAREALRAVVTDGTGKMMNKEVFHISGKTGTARMAFEGGGYERGGLRQYQATFCGFFPSENPEYSVIVVLYSGKTAGSFYGATQAGPPFLQIARFIYANTPAWNEKLDGSQKNHKRSNPDVASGMGEASKRVLASIPVTNRNEIISGINNNRWVTFSSDTNAVSVEPLEMAKDSLVSVKGMGLKDAIYILENQGYKVKFTGHGKVVSQTPQAGCDLPKGETVTLQLES
ncbi:MAG: transpeptidase family protein [Bacteroidales bacterium]|nr:transpeptidase family protein [Bacteroidales bacterium]MBQ2482770.1 transpeptidase family protein [Bacteroidales bacterium]MBQ4198136.1 transpeptidase family protein [Bacteroidales bacterium]